MSTHRKDDVGISRDELIPHIVAVVDIGFIVYDVVGISRRSYGIARINRRSVLVHICVGRDDYVLVGICSDPFACPIKHGVACAVVKGDYHIVEVACGEIVNGIGVVHRSVWMNVYLVNQIGIAKLCACLSLPRYLL